MPCTPVLHGVPKNVHQTHCIHYSIAISDISNRLFLLLLLFTDVKLYLKKKVKAI